jgi:hypothetical protein
MKPTDLQRSFKKNSKERERERERERDGCSSKSSQSSKTKALCNSPETQPTPSRS